MTRLGDPVPPVELQRLDGSPVRLDEHLDGRPLLILAVRYYGCLPCQHYLLELDRRRDDVARRGVDVIVVGVAADFQARHLAIEYGVELPLLLDPDQNLYRVLELPRLRSSDFLRPRTWKHYAPLFWRRYVSRRVDGPTQGRIVGDPAQLPGLALLDAAGRLRYLHRGQSLGDYPPLEEVLAEVDAVAAPPRA